MKFILEVNNLSVFFNQKVVDNVSFQLHENEVVGIIGRNGCGKSTMLRGMMGSLKQTGTIKVLGEDFLSMKIKERARKMSMLTQGMKVIEGIRAKELIELGYYPYAQLGHYTDNNKLNDIAKLLNIQHLLEKDYTSLSQGQKQLVQIARIFMQDTPIMLLDEPDTALDFDNCHMMFQALHTHIKGKGKGAMIVLHNPTYALMYCDRVLLMDEGQLIEEIIPHQESCEVITQKMQLLYPNIVIKKDPEFQQYYYFIK